MTEAAHTVLVVDDEEDVRDSIGALLESVGYGVTACVNGRDALETLRSGTVAPCVIILDLMMPVMDGWQFRSEQMRETSIAGIPVVIFSAHSAAREAGKTLGVAGVVSKGDVDQLLGAVTECCPI